jgi:hypothetical protein
MNRDYPPVRMTARSAGPLEITYGNIKRPRGRPKQVVVKTFQVNIKMTKDQRRRFKMAAAYHDIDYSELVEKALDALEFMGEEEG